MSEWEDWIKINSHSLSLSDSSSYGDLAFLKNVLKGKRVVLLGENSHGVAEFTTLKSRMVRYLHDSLGFDVLAFESNLGDTYYANSEIIHTDNQTSVYNALSSLWHVQEIYSLFHYARKTHNTSSPLTLSGVDFISSNGSYSFSRFLHNLIKPLDPIYAQKIRQTDSSFTRAFVRGWTMASLLSKEELFSGAKMKNEWLQFYSDLQIYLKESEVAFKVGQRQDLLLANYGVQDRIDCIHFAFRDSTYMANQLSECRKVGKLSLGRLWDKYRDFKMAEHLRFLYTELYRGHKIIVWAQDSHIYKAKCHLAGDSTYSNFVYSIAFQGYSGQGCYNLSKESLESPHQRKVYKFITPKDSLYVENILHGSGHEITYVDMLHQTKCRGNSWMFEKCKWTEWNGEEDREISEDIRSMFDAFILVDKISPPTYIPYKYDYLHSR